MAAALLHAMPAQAAPSSPDLNVYVSPTGRDVGSGSAAHPFKTLDHARDYVRDVKQKAKGDIHVRLMSGTYPLSHTFALTAQDSGRDGHRIVYEAAPGAHPVISGGKRITGWVPADGSGGVYKAKVGDIDTRQLYVDGELETRARSAKNPSGFSKTSTGYTFTDPGLNTYKRPSDLEVVSSWGWKLMRCPVQSIADNKMTMRQPCWHNAHLQQGQEIQNPTWLENARELLDTPGEWYLDKGEGEIYYMPKAGQNLSTATVTVPLVQDLVDLNGTRTAPVSNVSFRGITFSYSTWLAPSSSEGLIEGQAGFRMVGNDPDFDATRLKWHKTPGAVNVTYGHGIGFEGNTFTHLGAVGLNLNTGTQGTDITGNVFRQIAATGIQIGGVEVIDAHPDDSRDITKNTRVANNVVTKVADQYNGSIGILAGYTDHTTITHNKVYDLPYTGISVGWGWGLTDQGGNSNYSPGNLGVPIWDTPTTSRDTKVTDNEIYDIMKSQADGGAVYTLSSNPGGVVSGNYIHGIPSPAYGAIYHDEGSRYWTNTGNALCDVAYQWLFLNHGMDINATGNFTTQPAYSAQANSTGSTISGNTTVGSCAQLPASVVNNAGLQPGYRHLDPGPDVSDHQSPSRPGTPVAVTDFPTVTDLTWAASTDDTAVTGYSVYRDGKLISATGKTSVRLPGLTAGKTYAFKITARDAAGNESSPSPTLHVTMPSGADLALKRSITASSYSQDNTPEKAVDGDLSTRWAQGLGLPDPSWIQVDLGASYDVNGAITAFEKASGYKYRIEVSPDEVHWKTLVDRTAANTTAATDYAHTGDPVAGRFVRLTVTGSSWNGGSIYDFQVYGTPRTVTDHTAPTAPGQPTVKPLLPGLVDVSWSAATDDTGVTSYVVHQDGKRIGVTDATTLRVSGLTADSEYSFTVVARDEALNASDPSEAAVVTTPADHDLALDKPVTASSSYSEDYAPEMAVDGDLSTRWAQGAGLPDPSWIRVDLGKDTGVSSVVTTFEKAGGYKYRLEYSTDGTTWSMFEDHTSDPTSSSAVSSFADKPVTARYLRLTVTGSGGNGGSIYGLQAYGGF